MESKHFYLPKICHKYKQEALFVFIWPFPSQIICLFLIDWMWFNLYHSRTGLNKQIFSFNVYTIILNSIKF